MLNHQFWRGYFETICQRHTLRLMEVLENRIIPTFANLGDEAGKIGDKFYAEMMGAPSDGEIDSSDYAELASDAAWSYYDELSNVRQAVLNSFSPLLYHAWEQQLLIFHRRELLDIRLAPAASDLSVEKAQKALTARGINLTDLPSWGCVMELRLVANTVKHAEGGSAEKLKSARPDYFTSTDNLERPVRRDQLRAYAPLSGDDLTVSLDDLKGYASSVAAFWTELADALEAGDAPAASSDVVAPTTAG